MKPQREREYWLFTNCTLVNANDILDMTDKAVEVTLATVRRHCNLREFQRMQDYAIGGEKGLHLKDDWHVTYHQSWYKGVRCYYIQHSCIEYIFIKKGKRK